MIDLAIIFCDIGNRYCQIGREVLCAVHLAVLIHAIF